MGSTQDAIEDEDGLICVCTFYGRLVWPSPMEADRWCVVWWAPERCEAYFSDREKAVAYASYKRGVVVRLAALEPWPKDPPK